MRCGRLNVSAGGLGLVMAVVSFSLAASVFGAEEPSAPADKVKVFIFAGQSNMVGRSNPKHLPEGYRQPLPNVRLYANHGWRDLSGPLTGPQDGIGPEISAARLLADAFPGEKILIVKSAVGGTNLHTQWNPEIKNSLYAKMLEDVAKATAGQDYAIEAFFWAQGGSDAKDEAGAKAYGKNLAAFIAQARKDFGRPDLPFIFSTTKPDAQPWRETPHRYMAEVAKGKLEVSRTVPHTAVVAVEGLTYLPDRIHFDTPGTIEFGRRFFEVWNQKFHQPHTTKTSGT